MKTFVIDIDGTICTNTEGDYVNAEPLHEIINKINYLYRLGHKIVLFTARGTTTGLDWREITENQLQNWGVNFTELILGKPFGNYYIDDKSLSISDFKDGNFEN